MQIDRTKPNFKELVQGFEIPVVCLDKTKNCSLFHLLKKVSVRFWPTYYATVPNSWYISALSKLYVREPRDISYVLYENVSGIVHLHYSWNCNYFSWPWFFVLLRAVLVLHRWTQATNLPGIPTIYPSSYLLFIYFYFYAFLYASIFTYLSIFLSFYVFIYPSIYYSICSSGSSLMNTRNYLSRYTLYVSIHLSIYPSIYLFYL